MAWNKLKSMFVVSDGPGASGDADAILKDLEKYELPPGEVGSLPPQTPSEALSGSIDFQGLYDQAGIPNTDEVEALERFLSGLDQDLPGTSKVAAARAFLGAIGKAPKDVVEDAGRKIQVVRAVADVKRSDTENSVAQHQSAAAQLQKQIDEHRASIESLHKDLEAVRGQCAVEESRLQGARVFFGHLGEVAAPQAAAGRRK